MKKFYLAIPVEYEEDTLRKILELGAVQLTRDIPIPIESAEKNQLVEVCKEFARLYERLNSIVANTVVEKIREENVENTAKPDFEIIKSLVDKAEEELANSTSAIAVMEEEIKNYGVAQERLDLLDKCRLRVDDIGKFPHIFVKAGFMMINNLPKLSAYVGGTSVVFVANPGRPRENLVVVTGLNEDEPLTEMVLKLLNFEEFTFPLGLNSDPKKALLDVNKVIELKKREIQNLKEELAKLRIEFDGYELYVSTTLGIEEAKGLVVRTKKKCLIHGWVASDKIEIFKKKLEEVVPADKIYLRFDNPKPEEKVPAEFKNKGILGPFSVFANLQGTTNYFEVNPTPIYAILFVAMFGMMFGDVGLGSIFILAGFLLTRIKKGLFSFSRSAVHKIGHILVCCGIVGVFFGFLYGEFFLTDTLQPILMKPIDNMNEIMIIALVFGVAQITIAMVLNIINNLKKKDSVHAIFNSRGIIGLSYYSAGIFLAIAFINKMDFGVFLENGVLIFTAIALASLVLIFFSPTINAFAHHKEGGIGERIVEGFGEGLETLIALIANSASYIRLAAFAIAHDALALAALIFIPMIGSLPSYIFMNIVVFVIEGFAALIQSLRLMYYEFSTKFYVGGGVKYRPLKIIHLKTKI